MEIKNWEEISREVIFEKYSRAVDRVVFKLQSGKEDEYYVRRDADVAAALVLTPDQRVVLTRQFRPGVKQIILDLPGGTIEPGEDMQLAAAREVLEETGFAGEITMVGHTYSDGYSSQKRYVGVMTDAIKVAEPDFDENECIETVVVPLAEFRKLLKSGRMTDVHLGYMALDFLGLL